MEFPVAAQPALSGVLLRAAVATTLGWILASLAVVAWFAAATQATAGGSFETVIQAIPVTFIYIGSPVMLIVGVLALLAGGISIVPVLAVRRRLSAQAQSGVWLTALIGVAWITPVAALTVMPPGSAFVREMPLLVALSFAVAGVVALLVTPNLSAPGARRGGLTQE